MKQNTTESCVVYANLKLSRHKFAGHSRPDPGMYSAIACAASLPGPYSSTDLFQRVAVVLVIIG